MTPKAWSSGPSSGSAPPSGRSRDCLSHRLAARRAFTDRARLRALNGLAEVSIIPPSIRSASREMGSQLLALGATWTWCAAGLAPFTQEPLDDADPWHHSVAFGLLGAVAGGEPGDVLSAYLHQAALGMIGAGVRAIPVGHTHGQQVLAYLHDDIRKLAAELVDRDPVTAGAGCPFTRSFAMSKLACTPGCFVLEHWSELPVSLADSPPEPAVGVAFHKDHDHAHDHDHMGRPGTARYAGPSRKVYTIGVAGPVGSGKTALVEAICRALWPEVNLAVITNDIYTHEDAEFLCAAGHCRSSASSVCRPAVARTQPFAMTRVRI